MKLSTFIVTAILTVSAVTAQAHEAKGPNGGKIVDFASGHVELTHTADEVTIFATGEADKPLETAGSQGRVVIQSGGKTTQVQLTPAAPNKLVGKLGKPLAKGAVMVLSATVGGKTAQARFTVD